MIATAAVALALIAPGHAYTTPANACHGRGYYATVYVRDVANGKRLRAHWNRDHDRLLFAGARGVVHFDGLRFVNRTRHSVRVRGWC